MPLSEIPTGLVRDQIGLSETNNSMVTNLFHVRHAANPRHLKFITGTNGVQICAMKEDLTTLPAKYLSSDAYLKCMLNAMEKEATGSSRGQMHQTTNQSMSLLKDPKFDIKLDRKFEEQVEEYRNKIALKSRKEHIFPPIRNWTKQYLFYDDTRKWRQELNKLAQMIGIMTADEIKVAQQSMHQSVESERQPKLPPPELSNTWRSTRQIEANRLFAQDEAERARRRAHSESAPNSDEQMTHRKNNRETDKLKNFLVCAEQGEREIWLLQVLCKILKTQSMQEIQTWLVSSDYTEKETTRELIRKSLERLHRRNDPAWTPNGQQRFGHQLANAHSSRDTQVEVDFRRLSKTLNNFIESQNTLSNGKVRALSMSTMPANELKASFIQIHRKSAKGTRKQYQ